MCGVVFDFVFVCEFGYVGEGVWEFREVDWGGVGGDDWGGGFGGEDWWVWEGKFYCFFLFFWIVIWCVNDE